MQDIVNFILKQTFVVKVIIFLIGFVIHSFFAVLLNKYHTVKYGKPSILAWIPVFNIFLLGKLAIYWILGIILVIAFFFGICVSFNFKELESIHNILPQELVLPYQIGYGILLLFLCVIVRVKYNKIVKEGTGKDELTSFVSKDFDDKEPQIVVNTKNDSNINDNFQYQSNNNQNNNKNI